jgi:hypothetical protein
LGQIFARLAIISCSAGRFEVDLINMRVAHPAVLLNIRGIYTGTSFYLKNIIRYFRLHSSARAGGRVCGLRLM